MGNCDFKTEKVETEIMSSITKNMFMMHFIIGRGGFGKVWRVEYKKTKGIFAMKIMSKFKVYQKKSITSVMNEKRLLENLNNPYENLKIDLLLTCIMHFTTKKRFILLWTI